MRDPLGAIGVGEIETNGPDPVSYYKINNMNLDNQNMKWHKKR